MLTRRRRPERPERSGPVRAAVCGAGVIASAGLGLFAGLGPAAVIGAAGIVGGHLWSWKYPSTRRRPTQVLAGLALLGAACLLLAELFGGVGHDPFPQGTFLLALLAITAFEIRTRVNCYSGLILGFLGVYAAASVSTDPGMIAIVLLFALAALAALALSYRADLIAGAAGIRSDGADVAATGDGLPGRRVWQRIALLGLLAVGTALGSVGTYLVLPRYTGALPVYPFSGSISAGASFDGTVLNPLLPLIGASGAGAPRSDYFGFAQEMQLDRYARPDNTLIMRVRSTGWSYWRMQTYETYTGHSWLQAQEAIQPLGRGADGAFVPSHSPQDDSAGLPASGTTIRQTFTLLRAGSNLIPAAAAPERIYFPSPRIWQRGYAGDLLAAEPLPAGTSFSVVSRLPESDPALLRAARGPDPAAVTAPDLPVPAPAAQVVQAAHEAAAGAGTRYDTVLRIIAYLQAHARYDLSTTAPLPGEDAVALLLATHRGFCEQFATSLTVLARLNGIPARLVTGFAAGSYDPLSGVFTVRAGDAHAWTEIYFPRFGWLPFDATPSYSAQPRSHAQGNWLLEALAGSGLPWPDWSGLLHAAAAPGRAGAQLSRALARQAGMFVLLPLALLVILPLALRRNLSEWSGRSPFPRRRDRTSHRRAVLLAYLAAERSLRRRGYPPRRQEATPWRYAQQVADALPRECAERFLALATLANQAAYAGPERTAADVAQARRLRREIDLLTRRSRDKGREHA